jgi:hypothetical protein
LFSDYPEHAKINAYGDVAYTIKNNLVRVGRALKTAHMYGEEDIITKSEELTSHLTPILIPLAKGRDEIFNSKKYGEEVNRLEHRKKIEAAVRTSMAKQEKAAAKRHKANIKQQKEYRKWSQWLFN